MNIELLEPPIAQSTIRQIVAFKIAGTTFQLTLDAHNDNRLIGFTGDVTIHEI